MFGILHSKKLFTIKEIKELLMDFTPFNLTILLTQWVVNQHLLQDWSQNNHCSRQSRGWRRDIIQEAKNSMNK